MKAAPCTGLDLARAAAVLLALLAATAARAARVEDGLLVHYSFLDGETDAAATSVADVTGNDYLGPIEFDATQAAWRDDSIGLQLNGGATVASQVTAQTSKTIAELKPLLGNRYSIELWFSSPDPEIEMFSVLFGFRNYSDAAAGVSVPDGCDASAAGVQAAIGTGAFDFELRNNPGGSCITAGGSYPTTNAKGPDYPHHLVLTIGTNPVLTGSDTDVVMVSYVDGRFETGSNSYTDDGPDPTLWPDVRLAFSPPHSIIGMSGVYDMARASLFSFAIYDHQLNATEISQNFAAGIPNSRPNVVSKTSPVVEDTSTTLTLESSDFDGDNVTLQLAATSLVDGTTLTLDYSDGPSVNISDVELPFNLSTTFTGLTVLTPKDFEGDAGNITYRGFDEFAMSLDGVIAVDVTPVNDPPVARTDLSATPFAEEATVLTLAGTDPDVGDSIDGATITALPANGGKLYQFDSEAADNLGAEITLDAPDVTDEEQRVIYIAAAAPLGASGQTEITTDDFDFTVSDSSDTVSLESATFSVTVLNNLAALAGSISTDEDTEVLVNFTARQSPTDTEALSLVILSLPASAGATLRDNGTGSPVTIGDADLPYKVAGNAMQLLYLPGADLYGDPLDTILFAVERDSDNFRSSSANISTVVASVNDPPSTSISVADESSRVNGVLQFEAKAPEPTTFGVTVSDPDADDTPYRITVNVQAFGATVTFDQSAYNLSNVEFRSNDGIEDQLVVFLALREDVNDVLSSIQLTAVSPGEGEVQILVSDEAPGGSAVTVAVPFVVLEDPDANSEATADTLTTYIIYGGIATVFMLVLLCCCCCVKHCRHEHELEDEQEELMHKVEELQHMHEHDLEVLQELTSSRTNLTGQTHRKK